MAAMTVAQVLRRAAEAYAEYLVATLGTTNEGRRLFVAFTVRRNRVRVISARPMSRRERAIHDGAKEARER